MMRIGHPQPMGSLLIDLLASVRVRYARTSCFWKRTRPLRRMEQVTRSPLPAPHSRIRLRQDHLLHFLSLLHHPRDYPNGKVPSIYL